MNIEVKPADDRTWVLASEDDVSPEKTRAASRFTISNGFLGVNGGCSTVRGMRSGVSGRTYVAGLFDTPEADHAVPELVPAADWLRVRLLLSGQPMVCDLGDAASDRIRLDMKRGVLRSETRCSGAHGLSFRVNAECLVSMDDRTLGLQVVRFEIETGIAELTLEAWFDDPGLVCELTELAIGAWRTQRSGKRLAMATALSLQIDGLDRPPTALGPLRSSWGWTARPGQVVCFERMVTIVRSDIETVDPRIEARRNLDLARQVGCDGVVRAHEMAWASRWRGSDIVVDGDAA
ncbi:MAG: hypothetical protein QOH05_3372, partial [Acetobacteraceae bacterium]|nr:hypothetical protein [Acetobacteraceae bacterium]